MVRANRQWLNGLVVASVLALPGVALSSDIGSPSPEAIEGLYPGKTYSPDAQRSFPSEVTGETRTCTHPIRPTRACSATRWASKKPTAPPAARR